MICDICLQAPHHPQCPNYSHRETGLFCDICGEEISPGEEYIENKEGNYAHFDCFYTMRQLLKWLGYDIKEMKDFKYGPQLKTERM